MLRVSCEHTRVCMYTLMYTPNIALKEKKHSECMAGEGGSWAKEDNRAGRTDANARQD